MQITEQAKFLAKQIVLTFYHHDRGNFTDAAECLSHVYMALFPHIKENKILEAAKSYCEALRLKDIIDTQKNRNNRLTDPRWSPVYDQFLITAKALQIDTRWAYHHLAGYQKHKGEIEYWSDLMKSESFFLESAAIKKDWLIKKSDGRNGPGPMPFLYMVSAECHDLHNKKSTTLSTSIMEIYFTCLLEDEF